jgi:hypothetical protein
MSDYSDISFELAPESEEELEFYENNEKQLQSFY